MRIYTVYIDPRSAAPDRGAVLVREGFSWPAAIFSLFWALYHGLWGAALAIVALGLALGAAEVALGFDLAARLVLDLASAVLVGATANDWRRWSLRRAGYLFAGVVVGRDLAAAEARFFAASGATLG